MKKIIEEHIENMIYNNNGIFRKKNILYIGYYHDTVYKDGNYSKLDDIKHVTMLPPTFDTIKIISNQKAMEYIQKNDNYPSIQIKGNDRILQNKVKAKYLSVEYIKLNKKLSSFIQGTMKKGKVLKTF